MTQPATQHNSIESKELEPHGQLLKMLLPRAQSISIHDREGALLWSCEGLVEPELAELVESTLQNPSASRVDGEGFAHTLTSGATVYLFNLVDRPDRLVGVLAVLMDEREDSAQPFSMVSSIIKPLVECIQRQLVFCYEIESMRQSSSTMEKDLELLLSVSERHSADAEGDRLGQMVQSCVAHFRSDVGAIIVPDKNIRVIRVGTECDDTRVHTVEQTQKHLLKWAHRNKRPLVVNKVASGPAKGDPAPARFKILSCPIIDGNNQVTGVFALFNAPEGPDFNLRQLRLLDLLARRAASVLQENYDHATGVMTRQPFQDRVDAILAEAPEANHCMLYADMDKLHVINDTCGHQAGDEVIVRFAEIARNRVSDDDVIARIAGDRFAVFLSQRSSDEGHALAQDIATELNKLDFVRGDRSLQVSASFGVASFPDAGESCTAAMAAAEVACQAAKDRGRNRVEVYQDADMSIVRRHHDIHLVGHLQSALEQDSFRLDAQLIESLQETQAHPRYELLLRMMTDDGHAVPPNNFFSAAERHQLIPAIDRWVIKKALELLSAPQVGGIAEQTCFAINVSGQSLSNDEFLGFVEKRIAKSRVPPVSLCFEITETAAVANLGNAQRFIDRLGACRTLHV